jgi:hypothetical protein
MHLPGVEVTVYISWEVMYSWSTLHLYSMRTSDQFVTTSLPL